MRCTATLVFPMVKKLNRREFMQFVQTMKLRRLTFKWEKIDAVRHHGTKETLKHFLMKCVISRILHQASHHHFTEFEFPNKAEADIYDAKENMVYEVESRKSPKVLKSKMQQYLGYARDMIVFYCEDFSDDPSQMEMQLKKKMGF